MQFKHPEILYALFLLLIPIFIHLFQLRKFQKVAFSNVAFLKKVNIETRKSSQLKKWLTLLARLIALAAIIIAFAQPFSASENALTSEKETVIYLDNSYSMQAKGVQGPLLQRSKQQLYDNLDGTEKISWFTNDFTRKRNSVQDVKAELLQTTYSNNQLSPQEVLLKARQLFSGNENSLKQLIIISDFQQKERFPTISKDIKIDVVHTTPNELRNISIDTAYIVAKNAGKLELKVQLSATGDVPSNVPVSLGNSQRLLAKTTASFADGNTQTVTFDVDDPNGFNGSIYITDPNLRYDNTLYFSSNAPDKINVLSISEASSNFLQRIFDQPEFEYVQQTHRNANYNLIASQNFIILNELKEIPTALTAALRNFVSNGGSICFIPSDDGNTASYNALLNTLRIGSYSEKSAQEKKISTITFDHPLYSNVFEKRVVNFQYPKVNSYYATSSNATAALKYEDGKPFVLNSGKVFMFTAGLNATNSNFQNSPLIVPTFFNMAQLSLPLPQLYYEVGAVNEFSIPVKLVQDEIVTFKDSITSFIPLQVSKANQVDITTLDEPASAGTFAVVKKELPLLSVSYNYNRAESVLQYNNPNDWNGVTVHDSMLSLFDTIQEENTVTNFWKWFALLALLFLLVEMLILKFYKK